MVANNQVVSRKTADSLRTEATENEGILWGAPHIRTLETGISPADSVKQSEAEKRTGMLKWLMDKHGTTVFVNIAQPNSHDAFLNQRLFGSTMFRLGQTRNVYTGEVPGLVDRIKSRIGQRIIETKIIE